MDVNAALPSRAALLRQSGVLRQIPSDQNLPHAYRNSPSYGTLPPSRCAVRSNCMKRILIIEDDRDIVELVRYNLANEGFQVSAAHDGSTGLSTLKKRHPISCFSISCSQNFPAWKSAGRFAGMTHSIVCPFSCSRPAAKKPTASLGSRWAPTIT